MLLIYLIFCLCIGDWSGHYGQVKFRDDAIVYVVCYQKCFTEKTFIGIRVALGSVIKMRCLLKSQHRKCSNCFKKLEKTVNFSNAFPNSNKFHS